MKPCPVKYLQDVWFSEAPKTEKVSLFIWQGGGTTSTQRTTNSKLKNKRTVKYSDISFHIHVKKINKYTCSTQKVTGSAHHVCNLESWSFQSVSFGGLTAPPSGDKQERQFVFDGSAAIQITIQIQMTKIKLIGFFITCKNTKLQKINNF